MNTIAIKNRSRRSLALMDKDWDEFSKLLPAASAHPMDAQKMFRSIYSIGWMSGHLAGFAEGLAVGITEDQDDETPTTKESVS